MLANLKKLAKLHWPIIAILIVAAFLRFWRLDELTTFGGDLGYDLQKIKEILTGNFTLLGPPIGRFGETTLYLGPLYYYLQAPFIILTRFDPAGAAFSIVLARLATTFLIYLVTRQIFGLPAAVFGAIVSTLSPYWVNSLGPPSPPYIIPTLVSLIIFLVLKLKEATNWPIFLVLGFLSGLAIHLHYLGLVTFPALLFFIIWQSKHSKIKHTISLLSGLILAISPLILFEARNQFFLTNQFIKQLTSGVLTVESGNFIQKIGSALNFMTADTLGFQLPIPLMLLLIAFVVFKALKNVNSNLKPIVYLLITLLLANILAASFYFGSLQPHYLAAAYPTLFIFTGYLVSTLKKAQQVLPFAAIGVISIFLFSKNNFFSPSGYTMPEDLTLPTIRQISKIIAADVKNETFNITSTLDGDARALPYRYLVDVYGKKVLGVEQYDRGQSLYVITRDPAGAVRQNSLFEIASFQPANIAKVWNIKGDIKLIKLSKVEKQDEKIEKFVTIVNPVRPRDLWSNPQIESLKKQLEEVRIRNLAATWLLQYDTLDDLEIVDVLKGTGASQELGAFLEVSEKWATAARVPYKVGEGDYYRPDKIFLSGYTPGDREKLIKTYFAKFQQVFGQPPKAVGAWYLDATSQTLLAALGVKSALTVADQYDTDAASIWGKYFSMPYYPSKYNSLEPAINQSNRIPVVNIQWAQRHPILGYGKDIESSRHSFQANDYINNGFDSSYFVNLLDIYLNQQKTDFVQITIGLEAGQEGAIFLDEFAKQLEKIEELQRFGEAKVIRMSEFANWYESKYPGISPSHFLTKDANFWYMSPKFRVGFFKEDENFSLVDLRYYHNIPHRDLFYADENIYLDRKVPAQLEGFAKADKINLGPLANLQILENFDRLTIISDNRIVQINTQGIEIDGQPKIKLASSQNEKIKSKISRLAILENIRNMATKILIPFKFSKIDGEPVAGLTISDNQLIGFKGVKPGIYKFDFQSFSKFLTPANLIQKWQPWIN